MAVPVQASSHARTQAGYAGPADAVTTSTAKNREKATWKVDMFFFEKDEFVALVRIDSAVGGEGGGLLGKSEISIFGN